MRVPSILAVSTFLISSVMGITLTNPPMGASIPAEGIKQITWTFVNTDPSQMDIRCTFPDFPFNGTLIASAVTVTTGVLTFSQTLPVGDNARIQCTQVDNPTALLAESGPINILGGTNPFSVTGESGSVIAGTVSVFSVPANSAPFPVTTITDALLTTSFPTVATVVSSAITSVSTVSVLTTTTTQYSSLVGVISTGTILLPLIDTESGNLKFPLTLDPPLTELELSPSPSPIIPPIVAPVQVPFVTVPSYIAVASFSKWKRVADGSSVPLAAITISGTRGLSSSSAAPTTSSIFQPGTTISAPATTFTTTPPPVSTFTPPPLTVTLPPSVVTIPPTIITVTPTVRQNSTVSSHIAPPIIVTPSGRTTSLTTTLQTSTATNTTTTTRQPLPGTECAICTSGLINAGNTLLSRKGLLGWIAWTGVTAGILFLGLPI